MSGQPQKKTSTNVEAKSNYDIKEKILQNALIPINKLPNELLKRIVRFIDPVPRHRDVSYTSVCHHWRTVFIQNSSHDSGTEDSDSDYGSASDHDDESVRSVGSGLQFLGFIDILDDMRTLRGDLYRIPDVIDRLSPVLPLVSKLSLTIHTANILHFVLGLLHNSPNLHTLELLVFNVPGQSFTFTSETILPELQFLTTDNVSLLDGIRAPKLSSWDIQCSDRYKVNIKNPSVLQGFGCSSIRYLHVLDRLNGGHTFLGLKKPIHPKSVFSLKSEIYEAASFVEDVNEMTFVDNEDYLSDTWTRDCFRLNFILNDMSFEGMLKNPFHSILPQLTGLLELCIASDTLLSLDGIRFDKILVMVPSLEVLTILHNECEDDIMEFLPHLGNKSLCSRLKHLSYYSHYRYQEPESPEMAERVGKLLAKSLKSRHKVHGDVLKHVVLGNCPIPDTWLKEIQKLGTTVVANPMPDDVAVTVDPFVRVPA